MILRLETTTGDALAIAGDRIADPESRADLTIDVGPGQFQPGLINAHDHLHRNHYPRLGSPPYQDAYLWGTDIHARNAPELARAKSLDPRAALLFGALKNIVGGATTVVHHDAWQPAFEQQFPVRVARVRTMHSLGFERDWAAARTAQQTWPDMPLCIHLAEGINQRAADEVADLDWHHLLDRRLLAVHCVGVDKAGIAQLQAARAAVVWCPTSNVFLFGRTAPAALLECGIDVLLGTDALLTGEGTLLDELQAARALNVVDHQVLLDAVGRKAAHRLGLPAPSLEPGALADVILLRRPLLEARAADVALVLVGGQALLVDATIDGLLAASAGEMICVGGVNKIVPAALARAAQHALDLSPECARMFQ
ncbi:MAG: amidohydrolase family protein [Longimicrobiales bacterium]